MSISDELLQELEQYDPKTRDELLRQLQDRIEEPPYIWYCKRGRACDGKPHDGVPYNHARPDQRPPEGRDWFVWLIVSGRGSGKTRTGSQWVKGRSKHSPRIAVIGRRISDIRETLIEGESGLIRIAEKAKVGYLWEPSKRVFTFDNGCKVSCYSGEEPDSLRGPEHSDAWLDEPAHMPLIESVWSNLMFGLRLGRAPKVLATSTPLPRPWLKELIKKPDTRVVRVSTYVNIDNLAPTFRKAVIEKYEGTRLGRQELDGEVLEDVEGALWNTELHEKAKILPEGVRKQLEDGVPVVELGFNRIVVGVDPAGTANKRSDETGIIVAGAMGPNFYVLADYTGKYSPDEWAKKVIHAYKTWKADRVVVEKNYGGDMVSSNMRNQDDTLPITEVTSRRGKDIRAEPVVGLYEQGRVKHLGDIKDLETEQLEWVPGETPSPNRVDAAVHAITNLSGGSGVSTMATPLDLEQESTQPQSSRLILPGNARFSGGIYIP